MTRPVEDATPIAHPFHQEEAVAQTSTKRNTHHVGDRMPTQRNPHPKNSKKVKGKKASKPLRWDTSWAEKQSAKNKALIEAGETFASQKRSGPEKSPSAYKETR